MKLAAVSSVCLLLIPSLVLCQNILFSPTGGCTIDGTACADQYDRFYVFIYAQDIQDVVGVSFRLESSRLSYANIQQVEQHENITIESGDLFSGITLSWPSGEYNTDTLMTIFIDPDNRPFFDIDVCWTRDVRLFRANGDTLQLHDGLFYCTHCTGIGGAGYFWYHPDTLTALIGEVTTLRIKCQDYTSSGIYGTNFDLYEQLNWIESCPNCWAFVDCGGCIWDYQYVVIDLMLPAEVVAGTINQLRIVPTESWCLRDSTTFCVKAVSPVGVNKSSWSRIKSIKENKEY